MIKTVKQVGGETLDGIPCRLYEYTCSGEQFGVQTQGKVRLWVAENDGLLIKQVTEGQTAGYSIHLPVCQPRQASNLVDAEAGALTPSTDRLLQSMHGPESRLKVYRLHFHHPRPPWLRRGFSCSAVT